MDGPRGLTYPCEHATDGIDIVPKLCCTDTGSALPRSWRIQYNDMKEKDWVHKKYYGYEDE